MTGHTGFQIIGHRGAAGHAPENTEAAILAGLRLGATAIEVDVQFTSDGTPVVFHDRTLERMAGVKGRIRDHASRQLAGYDVGFRFGEEHRGLRILSLDEAARLVPADVFLHVEIKDHDAVTAAHLKDLVAILRKQGGLERCIVTSFNEKILSTLRGLEGRAHRGLLVSGRANGAPRRAQELGCVSLHPEAALTDQSLVDACRSVGLKVFPFTANEAGQMRHLRGLGVDGVYTDFPGRLAEVAGRPARAARAGHGRAASHGGRAAAHADHAPRAEPEARGAELEAVAGIEPEATPLEEGSAGAPAAEHPAGGTAPASSEGLPRKRRRRRRGGRKHRRRKDAAPPETPPAGDAQP